MAIRAEEIEDRTGCVDIDRDRLLVVRHQDGDHAAFDELYRRYHGRLVGYCHRRVGDRHVAEELAQEAFVRAFRAMPAFAGERRFYPWMTVIAQRLCIDHHRRAARVEPAAEVDTGSVDPDHDELWAAVDRRHLGSAFERLAPRHREILELREQRGWSYQQIATHLDVPLTTVEALLHRARKALRREYLAVAGEDAAGRLVAFGGLAAIVVRAKGWLAALGPERLIPAVGTAAAGVAAIGAVVVAPIGGPDSSDGASDGSRTSREVVETSAPTSTAEPGAPTDATASAATAADGSSSTSTAPNTPGAGPLEPPADAVSLGVATWYPGAEGSEYVRQAIDCMPLQLDIFVADVGIEPEPILGPLWPLVASLLPGDTGAPLTIAEPCG